jgi:GNAT superfamily N-acetyltransferase
MWTMTFVVETVRFDDPAVGALVAEIQAEYVVLYGTTDTDPTPVEAFLPPAGLFLLGRHEGAAVAMGGWRRTAEGAAEIKRMYVAASARGLGLGRAMLAALEQSALDAGITRMVLNTGVRQLAAIELYRSVGYLPSEPFGHHRDTRGALFFERSLNDRAPSVADGA